MTDPMYDDEWDEQYESGAAPLVALEEQAESHARCLRYWQQQHDDVAARFEAEITRLTDRAKQAKATLKARCDWHEMGLKRFYESRGEKRIMLANATLSSTRGRQYIMVEDIDALASWADAEGHPEVLRHKVEADRNAIMEHIKSTGEEPAGCKVERNQDALKIKF